ncbi:hypothetical protein A2U01_0107551, partial [Trifolium medium]|nr:hypothetical protein [Trifolium medium]
WKDTLSMGTDGTVLALFLPSATDLADVPASSTASSSIANSESLEDTSFLFKFFFFDSPGRVPLLQVLLGP